MAQKTIIHRRAHVQIGRETAYATVPGTWLDIVLADPEQASAFSGAKREALELLTTSPYRADPQTPLQGLRKGSPAKFKAHIRQLTSRLNASATPVAATNSAALSHQLLYEHWLGGEHVAAGSLIVSSGSSTTVTVTNPQGSRFVAGTWVIVETSAGLEPRLVTNVSSNTLTLWPEMAGSPVLTTGEVRNSYSYYLAEDHTQTLGLQGAWVETGGATTQMRLLGMRGQCSLSLELGQIMAMEFDGVAGTYTDPGDLSILTYATTCDMGAALYYQPQTWWQSASTAPSSVESHGFKLTLPNKWTEIPDGAGVEAVAGVVNVAGQQEPATWELVVRADSAQWTDYTAGTVKHLVVYRTVGTGTAARFWGVHIPRAVIDQAPSFTNENGVLMTAIKGRALIDNSAQGAGDPPGSTSTDAQRSPVRIWLA